MLDLIVVMPVYNEEACIGQVLHSWNNMLNTLNINFQILVLNDGSKDGTFNTLQSLGLEHCTIIDKANSGHGPTILYGYNLAVKKASWVFQCDSDDEMKADYFPLLWKERNNADAIMGQRENREQSSIRSFVSRISRFSINMLFGKGCLDVNVPYRLLRADVLEQIISNIPGDTFAPNIVIAGLLAYYKYSIINIKVPHISRETGKASLTDLSIVKVAAKSLKQTLKIRTSLKSRGRDVA